MDCREVKAEHYPGVGGRAQSRFFDKAASGDSFNSFPAYWKAIGQIERCIVSKV